MSEVVALDAILSCVLGAMDWDWTSQIDLIGDSDGRST